MEKGKRMLLFLSATAYLILCAGGCTARKIDERNNSKNEISDEEITVECVVPTPYINVGNEEIVEVIDEPVIEEVEEEIINNGWHDCNVYAYLTKNANLLQDESFNYPIEYLYAGEKVYRYSTNGTWDYVRTESGKTGYMEPYLLISESKNALANLSQDAVLYSDKEMTNPITNVGIYQMVRIDNTYGEITEVTTMDGMHGFINSYILQMLPQDIFVDTDISDQTTTLYRGYSKIYSTPIVSGNESASNYMPTDRGRFDIDAKTTNATLMNNSHVDYWMPYNGGEGLHDAQWRSNFGGTIYQTNGSHGCTNMPYDAAAYFYQNLEVGDIVLVHE